jgi:2-amino-4-hydroxy-6-hydroxymethyldihydropteridine diphosphokinase
LNGRLRILPELAFISLGSNIDPELHLPEAVDRLGSIGRVLGVSSAYRNPAVGSVPQPDFVNAAVLVETSLSPVEIRAQLRSIENDLGRIRQADKYAPRTIDLDLCYLGEMDMTVEGWALPDPGADQLAHLAIPFAELMPGFRHPRTGETLEAIAERLSLGAQLKADPSIRLTRPSSPATHD